MHRTFQDQSVVAQPVTMIGKVNDNCVRGKTRFLESNQNSTDSVVDQRDLPVRVRDNFAQLVIRLLRDAAVVLSDFNVFPRSSRFGREYLLVPPGSTDKMAAPFARKIDVRRIMQSGPRFRTIKRMMRVREN